MKTNFYVKSYFLVHLLFLCVAGNSQNSWLTKGNVGLNAKTNFLGTKDNIGLAFRTHNLERMRITNNGAIGIGTTSPAGTVNIFTGDTASLQPNSGYIIIGDSKKNNLVFDDNSVQSRNDSTKANFYINKNGGSTIIGRANSNEYEGLEVHGGYYGINVESGSTAIQAKGEFYGGIFNADNVGVFTDAGETGLYSHSSFSSAIVSQTGSQGAGIEAYSGGGPGIYARTDNFSYAAYFDGSIYATGIFIASDATLKKNISDVTSAMNIINQLKPKSYNYRQDGDYKFMKLPSGQHYGLLAQDVEKILPDAIKNSGFNPPGINKNAKPGNRDYKTNQSSEKQKASTIINFKAVNYEEFIPIVIKGMQEQQQDINQLKEDNQALQQQLNDLKQTVTALTSSKAIAQNLSANFLQQNTPNPCNNSTAIKCTINKNISNAQLVVSSEDGKPLQTYSVNNGATSTIQINTSKLASGKYSYSLITDGKISSTKSMLVVK